MISFAIIYHLPNVLNLDGPITVKELYILLHNTSMDIECAQDKIQLVFPLQ
jgi:hypothetical protein